MTVETPEPARRPGELTARELARWGWRQLTSMRTALVLLLLLALAAVPGSVIPQQSVDALGASQWKERHPKLTPIYEKLGLFEVYSSAWFAAVYLLLVVSLVGCIIPRTLHYWRAMRAQPPAAPRHLTRMPDHTTYHADQSVEEVHAAARTLLKQRGYRVRESDDGAVSAERGYLREFGNLVFHLSVVLVLVGFAMGTLLGYKGSVIVVEGAGFGNNPQQYDDFVPGRLFSLDAMDNFAFTVDDFSVEWLLTGPAAGSARAFNADLSYQRGLEGEQRQYDLRVNHPLRIGGTELFLVGHGYAPVITVRDGEGNVVYSEPTVFLPQDATFLSFGVVKAPDAQPTGIGLEGLFFPTYATVDGDPMTVMPKANNPAVSMLVWKGDLGMNAGASQSVYVLDKSDAAQVKDAEGAPLRIDLAPGQTEQLPDGLGSVTFESVTPWARIQISRTPGQWLALGGVVLALLGLLGSLYIRPRRVWVRARPVPPPQQRDDRSATMVELAALDRSNGGDVSVVLDTLVADLRSAEAEKT